MRTPHKAPCCLGCCAVCLRSARRRTPSRSGASARSWRRKVARTRAPMPSPHLVFADPSIQVFVFGVSCLVGSVGGGGGLVGLAGGASASADMSTHRPEAHSDSCGAGDRRALPEFLRFKPLP